MSTRDFDEDELEEYAVNDVAVVVPEPNPTTKLERRRKIEELFEERRLKAELSDFA